MHNSLFYIDYLLTYPVFLVFYLVSANNRCLIKIGKQNVFTCFRLRDSPFITNNSSRKLRCYWMSPQGYSKGDSSRGFPVVIKAVLLKSFNINSYHILYYSSTEHYRVFQSLKYCCHC